jgi:hypothetical protein
MAANIVKGMDAKSAPNFPTIMTGSDIWEI